MTPRTTKITIGLGLLLAGLAAQWLRAAHEATAASPATASASAEKPAPKAKAQPAQPAPATPGVVTPHRPAGYQPKVATGQKDFQGNDVLVSCLTCHTTREPNRDMGLVGTIPKEFHQGMVYAHAGQSCLSCHHAEDYDSLRLADGRKLPFARAEKLCAQCHGPQTRDYLHGSHGGMKGYWDQTKGGRTRNTCTDCHDTHAPAYPAWTPVFAPKDAGARQQAEREAKHPRSDQPLYRHD